MTRLTYITSLIAITSIMGCNDAPQLIEEGSINQVHQAIVNGSVDQDHQAVGVLLSGQDVACTATLISRNTVLTAAHCVTDAAAPRQILDHVEFFLGGLNGRSIKANSVTVHPKYEGGKQADLAVVQLSENVDHVSPMTIAKQMAQPGEAVLLLGFGKTGEHSGQFGVLRQATNVIGQVADQTMVIYGADGENGNLCDGDSGGPTLASRQGTEILIGVHSSKGGTCGQQGHDVRVDVYNAWITREAGGEITSESILDKASDAREITVEAGRRLLGELCQQDSQCGSNMCLPRATSGVCSKSCLSSLDCPTNSECRGNVCQLEAPDMGPALDEFGVDCAWPSQCLSGLCAMNEETAQGFCTLSCDLHDDTCPGDSVCQYTGAANICAPLPHAMSDDGASLGGCSISGQRTGPGIWFFLALLGLVFRGRKTSR